MLQLDIEPREGWENRLLKLGFDFYEVSSKHPYWCENRYFQLNRAQVDHIDKVTEELHELAIKAVAHVFDNDLLDLFGLPKSTMICFENHGLLIKPIYMVDLTSLGMVKVNQRCWSITDRHQHPCLNFLLRHGIG